MVSLIIPWLLVGLAALTEQAAQINIPMETFQFEDYFFTFYTQHANWLEAFTICRATHSRLAVIHNKARADFLGRTLTETQMNFEDIWIGGMFMKDNWMWAATERKIPMQKDEKGYPPWIRNATQRGKYCLAFDRKGYDSPLFVEMQCLAQKPFVCEKSVIKAIDNYPQMGIVTKFRDTKYIAYHARVTWEEALAFCRQTGMILATIPDMKVAYFIVGIMRRSRPEMEAMWIGGQYLFNEWVWLSYNEAIPNVTLDHGYPPWGDNSSTYVKGKDCLIIDHHACRHDRRSSKFVGIHARRDVCEEPVFLDTDCSRRKPFICEKGPDPDEKSEHNGTFGGITYSFINLPKTWYEAYNDCIARNMTMAKIDTEAKLTFVVTAWSEEMEDSNHVWLGGQYSTESNTWFWAGTNQTIPGHPGSGHGHTMIREDMPEDGDTQDQTYYEGFHPGGVGPAHQATDNEGNAIETDESNTFPPWCIKDTEYGVEGDCLNMDRGDHSKAIWYGLNCSQEQMYLCEKEASRDIQNRTLSSNSTTTYHLQHDSTNFNVAFKVCFENHMSLAIVNNISEALKVATIIPANQTIWVGGWRVNGRWSWKQTGEHIPDETMTDGYPPWETLTTNPGEECLAMRTGDRNWPVFVEQRCDKTYRALCQTSK